MLMFVMVLVQMEFNMCNESERNNFIQHFSKRNINGIYESAKNRSKELKQGSSYSSGNNRKEKSEIEPITS